MTDAHCHAAKPGITNFVCEPFASRQNGGAGEGDAVFFGFHPWHLENFNATALKARLAANPAAGVGEIGLDRLRDKTICAAMREAFDAQLAIAAELRRPVVLHGAKCWGEVVRACRPYAGPGGIPSFLFHGFSRSAGLIPEIKAMNGFVGVGPALLNDHAVNYRRMVGNLPGDMLLAESDACEPGATPGAEEVTGAIAGLRGWTVQETIALLDGNARRFLRGAAAT